jgi:RimJ/RimL family protein N-acetyltransferase
MPQGPFKNEISLKKYLKNKNLTGNPFFYTIYSKRLKTFCGLASYLRIKPQVGTIEVGYITYAKNLQRTVEGTEAMYLMMKNVFDDLGYRRYEWKCDNLNSKSKKAALRLGFKYEGLFRQATIYKKRNRDTAWFSIIDKEWKRYKKSYKLYLKRSNFNTKFIQKEKLKLT